ncbi:hypothetical protein [Magnetofaba australis]|uniref:hypothetical protein n=1 Tax=Magnetofaba australis TaxID=1472297 RepID=UPI000A19E30C|nr:hypothetical protein [Magnetofaba australis]
MSATDSDDDKPQLSDALANLANTLDQWSEPNSQLARLRERRARAKQNAPARPAAPSATPDDVIDWMAGDDNMGDWEALEADLAQRADITGKRADGSVDEASDGPAVDDDVADPNPKQD